MCMPNWDDRPDPPITASDVIFGILFWAFILTLPVTAVVKAYKNQTAVCETAVRECKTTSK